MGTFNDPDEIDGAGGQESGWFRLYGIQAQSGSTTLEDPAFLAALVERSGTTSAASLPFSLGTQDNGDLLPTGPADDL